MTDMIMKKANPIKRLRAKGFNRKRGWKFAGAVAERQDHPTWPVDFWLYKWVETGTSTELRDPIHGHRRMVRVWFVEADGVRHGFAADELSNGVWGFFLPA
ncbi:hypothetical protein [Paraurantiacibacter namhicola]|uniref:Uncharacterized protein n=1 Tax=Paraurantiacibacter namhicola TaxID=645517 RepID=A0A1C7DBC2_9SPHN|nr:hypothetical protein [Paraurantiacibacter namhicola]ANU08744.1 hypothetical protein A6F65_02463 [Paraurantiacibacter namhicola]